MATSIATNSSASADILASLGVRQGSTTSNTAEIQNRFLTLLTAQLKNQDPTAPMDSAQMTSQLAQISTVDGIERLNKTLQTLLSDSQSSQGLQAAALVGRGVLVPGNALTLSSGVGGFGYELAGPADEVTATIKDANGIVVRTLSLGSAEAGVQVVPWDGKADSGAQAADGKYTVSVSAKYGKDAVTASVLTATQVTGVIRTGSTMSVEAGGGVYALDEIKGIV